ncbi:uncharacterized protein LOC111693782 [Trichogramma pretiosum]|uniref:uncharacterized protein LOC111693782 n=1 Tax=Trichogramma pretiosum TaxID=7493 RepID=UPI000C71BAAC|nr:uncharacterized protein LOC111693782 [Trichogramma pretiosum]
MMGNFLQDTIEKTFKEKRATELYEAADKLNLDTSRCDQKINPVMEKFSAYHKDLEYCTQNTEPRYNFINDAQEAIDKLQNASLVIEGYANKARKCVEDATLWSSVSAAKCLAESILAAELKWLETPGYVDLIKFYDRYKKLGDKIEDCIFLRRYMIIKGEAEKTREEVNDCLFELVEASEKKENQSSGN